MNLSLHKKLETHIKEHYSSVGNFESTNSMPKNSIRVLLQRKSENNTISTLLNISKALGCSVDELLENKEYIKNPGQSVFDSYDLGSDLLQEILTCVLGFMQEHSNISKINKKTIFDVINEICNYCAGKNDHKFDPKFASWALEQAFLKS